MATGTNHWKLGLFVLVGIALLLTSLVLLGASNWNKASVSYVSYFDESVQGLELGSPVKFRGVTVGRVSAIDIAADHRHVAVTSELTVQKLDTLNLGRGGEPGLAVQQDLRVQLAQTGITGVKFVLLDYFDPEAYPAPELPFGTPPNYIPAAASTLKSLESSVMKTADRFPLIASDVSETVAKVNAMVDELDRGGLPERTVDTLDQANRAMRELNVQLAGMQAHELSRDVRQTLAAFNVTLGRVNQLLERIDGERGIMKSAQATADSMAEVARGAHSLGPELELTLREVRGAARSIRRFADTLERDPDMLLKGRAPEGR
jgi:phospholipid/cholesterol/gamma-HCH transport system substrate-binding protein